MAPLASPAVTFALALALALVAGCAGGGRDPDPVAGVQVADGYTLTEVVGGLSGPTQIAHHPDGRLLVAELNGPEKGGTGRVIAVPAGGAGDATSGEDAEPAGGAGQEIEVLLDGLLTPTGVAALDDQLWVMEQRTLSSAPLDGPGESTVVLDDLPFNGRSETTLTVTPAGTILYATTGSLDGTTVRDGSGVLWELDPVAGSSAPVAAGFKNAYAHVHGPDGRLWVTEVSDGSFDGARAPDELVEVGSGIDHGWPTCIGDRIPVAELGGDRDTCAAGPPSQALFAPGATPTSVAIAPWDAETLVVALWLERRVVAIPADPATRPHGPEGLVDLVIGEGFRPQHLLADGDRLLLVDHEGGRILSLTADR